MRNNLNKNNEFIGTSQEANNLLEDIKAAAGHDENVLITGDTGTGKEIVARRIHSLSKRAENSFVALNLSALPHELIETELFGYEKGAFTGSANRKVGRVELANRGTLLLDEISAVSSGVQAKLLRYLEDGIVQRLGGVRNIQTDVRIISATNEELTPDKIRKDLLYRLDVDAIHIPPLRERRDDIALIAEFYLGLLNRSYGTCKRFTTGALDLLQTYEYPGNVRELENIVRYAFVRSKEQIDASVVFKRIDMRRPKTSPGLPDKWPKARNALYEKMFVDALRRNNGSMRRAIEEIGTSYNTASLFIRKHYGTAPEFYRFHGIKPYKTTPHKAFGRAYSSV